MSSLILLPSEADQKKTFHALHVQPYLRLGVVRGHIDPVLIAAMCLRGAQQRGCEEIVVGLEGMLPRRYSIRSVEEQIRKHPRKFAGWVRTAYTSPMAQLREHMTERLFLPSSTTWAA